MTMSVEKLSFEEALARLEEKSARLRSGELPLEESLKLYEECVRYHDICAGFLAEARQKIELYRPGTGETEEFDEA
jgi:exodeoxyribonuclease VII small subunit